MSTLINHTASEAANQIACVQVMVQHVGLEECAWLGNNVNQAHLQCFQLWKVFVNL